MEVHRAPLLTLISSLAVTDAVEAEGRQAQVKWPNDVLLAGRKVAGVMAEWKARSCLGQRALIIDKERRIEGVAADIDEGGCLLVWLDDGSQVRVFEGEMPPCTWVTIRPICMCQMAELQRTSRRNLSSW